MFENCSSDCRCVKDFKVDYRRIDIDCNDVFLSLMYLCKNMNHAFIMIYLVVMHLRNCVCLLHTYMENVGLGKVSKYYFLLLI